MINFLKKLILFFRKPKVIIVAGSGRALTAEAIWQVLKPHFKVKKIIEKIPNVLDILKNDIFIIETALEKPSLFRRLNYWTKLSELSILVVTNIGEIPADFDFFSGEREKTKNICHLAKEMPSYGFLILNFDDETVREINDITNLKTFSFGFQERADFRASDVKINGGTNFKINYKRNIIPVWLDGLFGKEQIYGVLAASGAGTIFGLNFVEIVESFKDYKSLAGKMRLIDGIKKSHILDDSESASVFSMIEALETLKKNNFPRKIAVLGDVLGVGKYTIEAHEAIGEKVKETADLLFAVGARAKFIAEGAKNKGMPEENIFQFNEIDSAIPILKEKIKEEDLVLVDGSKEMKMGKIIEEIKM